MVVTFWAELQTPEKKKTERGQGGGGRAPFGGGPRRDIVWQRKSTESKQKIDSVPRGSPGQNFRVVFRTGSWGFQKPKPPPPVAGAGMLGTPRAPYMDPRGKPPTPDGLSWPGLAQNLKPQKFGGPGVPAKF